MYSVILTEKINALERVRSWANDCGHFGVRDHLANAISILAAVRSDVIRSAEAKAGSAEQRHGPALMNPITPHVRGNARLRRKLDRERERYAAIKRLVGPVLVLADSHGLGDHRSVVAAGAAIGWVRMTSAERERVAREIEEARG